MLSKKRRLPAWMYKKRYSIPIIILSIPLLLYILLCTVLVLNTAYYDLTVDRSPKPLGERLQYLGREANACPRDLLMCLWAQPYARYHYGTDMKPWELAEYFKGAKLDEEEVRVMEKERTSWDTYENGDAYTCTYVYLRSISADEGISLKLCKHAQFFVTYDGLAPTDKPYDLSIDEKQYDAAKRAL